MRSDADGCVVRLVSWVVAASDGVDCHRGVAGRIFIVPEERVSALFVWLLCATQQLVQNIDCGRGCRIVDVFSVVSTTNSCGSGWQRGVAQQIVKVKAAASGWQR